VYWLAVQSKPVLAYAAFGVAPAMASARIGTPSATIDLRLPLRRGVEMTDMTLLIDRERHRRVPL